jgi:hypothetical protein
MRNVGFGKRAFYYDDGEGIHQVAMDDSEFRKFWNREKMRRVLHQKVCKYCDKMFVGDQGAVIHHVKMQEKEAEAYKEKWEIKREVEFGDITESDGKAMIKAIEEGLISYYKSLQDTDLVCIPCHAKVHLNPNFGKTSIQTRLFY